MSPFTAIKDSTLYPRSVIEYDSTTFFLVKSKPNGRKQLVIQGDSYGFTQGEAAGNVLLFPLTAENAQVLRGRLDWLNPVPTGLQSSFGFGDRLGLATPGHIVALRAAGGQGQITPIFAQQSVRENNRTDRTPQEVMDDAMWGVFQEGWREPWAADADHVKGRKDIAPFVQAGYTFYTIDPSDYVDGTADHDPLLKYGRALRHTADLAQEIKRQMGGRPFDLEMSVDETESPTTFQEHFFIASELHRQQIPVNSLALRFPGKFQKGVDYIGDLAAFETDFAEQAQIMRSFGTYKLSIHTGSDKFSIYDMIARYTKGNVHVKTAGTSYLEALRVIAHHEPGLFRQILAHARDGFEGDRHSYFLDGRLENVPAGESVADSELPALLDQFDARQMLHVTFGSILNRFGESLLPRLAGEYETAYYNGLETHLGRHLTPFTR